MPPRSVLNIALLAVSVVVLAPAAVWAQVNVANEAELRTAIFNANTGAGPTTINLLNDIGLTQSLPMISSNITFDGGGYKIDAAGAGRVFFIESGTVSISNVVIENAVAQGGNGGDSQNTAGGGGGGGLGAGAAIFVNTTATVSVANVTVVSASATGGTGGNGGAGAGFGTNSGGGGGLGGNGGISTFLGGGGGGGYQGAGGSGNTGGGGGGGEFGTGGAGGSSGGTGGGGGGGQQGNGAAAAAGVAGAGGGGATANAAGTTGGGTEGGDGGASSGSTGQNAAAAGGGGGGGGDSAAGGNGAASGGGGGGGFVGSPGGAGGVGGGGGGTGGCCSTGGYGGAFGGGGGGGAGLGGRGGNGGYGGGGGGAHTAGAGAGGSGGFGGGGGGAAGGGAGGAFAGAGGSGAGSDGGGGAALGGAVFVATGGTLTITDGSLSAGFGTNTVTGGTGANNGQALGTTLFLHGTAATTLNVTAGTSAIFDSDAVAGDGGLTKTGAGILELVGSNPNYSGTTTIAGGTLSIFQDDSLGTGGVTLDGGALLANAPVFLNNNITLGAGNGTLSLGLNDVVLGGTISGGGSLSVGGGAFNYAVLLGDNTYSGGTSVDIISGVSLQHNNALGTGVLTMADFSAVEFGDGVNIANAINLQGDVFFGVLPGETATYSGVISGSYGFDFLGGTLTLTGANTYTGATIVSGGTLRAGAENVFGGDSAMFVCDCSTLDLNGFNQSLGSLDGLGNVTLGPATLTVGTNGMDSLFGGVISGAGSLTKVGTGTLTLSGANTYTGATTVIGGNLRAGAANVFGLNSATTVDTGATLELDGFDQTLGSLTGAGNVDLGLATLTVGANDTSTTFSGVISGAGSLTKTGTGTLTLSGANSYGGGTTIDGGTLHLANALALGSGGLTILGSNVSYADGVTITTPIELQANAGLIVNTGSAEQGGVISEFGGSFGITKTGAGTLILSGVNTYTGGTTVLEGTLALTNDDSLGTGIVTLDGGALRADTLIFLANDIALGAGNGTLDTSVGLFVHTGLISGAGSLSVVGGGGLNGAILAGDNTYTGGTIVAGGSAVFLLHDNALGTGGLTVRDNGGVFIGNGLTIANAMTLEADTFMATTGFATYGGVIGESGGSYGIELFGGGLLALSAANTYTGGTIVDGSAVLLAHSQALGTGGLTVRGNGAVFIDDGVTIANALTLESDVLLAPWSSSDSATYSGAIGESGGSYGITLDLGTLTLSGANTYTGETSVTGGTLRAGAMNVFGVNSAMTLCDCATLDLNGFDQTLGSLDGGGEVLLGTAALTVGTNNASTTFAGVISGAGGLTKTGAGVLTLSGANTYTGATIVESGVLRADAANVFGANSATTVNAGTTLALQGFNQSLGSLAGAGVVTLGGATLTVGGNSANTTFSGILFGAGALTKIGTGILALTGANTYSGGTTVAGGTLQVGTTAITSATLAGPVTVQGGATLAGTGTITGTVTINNGATLAPGASIGTLTTGTLNLTAGALLDFEFGAPGVSDRVIVNGDLTLDGTLNVIDAGGFGAGVYRIFDYTGLLTNNGLAIGTTPFGTDASDLLIQTSVAKQVNLLNLSGATFLFWDGTGPVGNGRIDGGTGTWSANGFGWTDVTGNANAHYSANRFAIFQGTAGTVTVSSSAGPVISGGMQFASDGYRVVGDAITLGQPLTTIRVGTGEISGAGMVATITSPLIGTGGLFKTDFGTLILGGASTYTGRTIIDAGTLRLGSPTALGLTSELVIGANGLLDLGTFSLAMHQILGTGTVGLGNGRLTLGLSDQTSTFAGRLTGGGVFVKTGTGRLTLTGANSHTGDTRVERGTLTAGVLGAFGLDNAITVNPGGTLDLNSLTQAIGSLAGDGDVGLGSTMLITGTDGTHTWFGGRISGRGGIVKTGTGRWTLAGNNDYTGPTVVAQGILQLGAGGGSIDDSSSITVLPGATLDLNGFSFNAGSIGGGGRIELGTDGMLTLGAGDVSSLFSGTLTGAGTLRKTGSGVLGLAGPQSYTGGTIVDAGALLGDSVSLSGEIVNDGVVVFDQAFEGLYAGTMSGTGSLVTRGAGTLTLSGANRYTGGTLVEAGTLVGSSQSLQGLVISNAALQFDQAFDGLFNGVLGGEGTFTKTGAGTLTLEGAHALTGLTTVAEGTLVVNGSIAGDLVVREGASIATQDQIGVVGDVTLNPGSQYHAAIDADGHGSMLVSNGTIRMGGARITLDTEDTASQRRIQAPIVYAAGGVLGEAAFSTDRAHLEGYLTGTGQTLFLTVLDTTVPLAASATSRNGAAAAAAIDRLRPFATGDQFMITRELAAMADADLTRALDVVSGEIHASAMQLTALDSEAAADLIRSEMRRRSLPVDGITLRSATRSFSPATALGGRRWWGQYGGQRVSFASTPAALGAAGYVGGFSLGLDFAPARHWILGAGGGYALGELVTAGMDNKVDTTAPRAMGYVGYGRGRWTAHAGTSIARTTYRTRRGIAFEARLDPQFGGLKMFEGVDRIARGEQTGVDTSAWIDLGFETAIGGWTLQPGAGFRAARYGYDAWSETGAGALSLSAPSQSLRSTQADLNLHVSRAAGGLRPYGSLTYRRELGKGLTETMLQFGADAAGQFRVQGQPFASDRMIGGVGLTSAQAGLSFGYRVDSGGGQTRHAVDFGVRFD